MSSQTRTRKKRIVTRVVALVSALLICGGLYDLQVERLLKHGRLRAEAMTIRDTKADNGGVTEAGWARINELLSDSWRSLANAVKS